MPSTLSASSIKVYESCSARWKAEYGSNTKGAGIGGSAADLGTVCHAALEAWVADGHYSAGYKKADDIDVMSRLFDVAYWTHFGTDERHAEGLVMCLRWLDRQDWTERTVISTEVKETFDVPASTGPIPFNYIWDRCDRLSDGDIEVIDYKTFMVPRSPDDLRHDVQARLYGVAANIKYPDAPRIWVTFDQLRHQAVGTCFTRDENRAAYRYLLAAAERIIADDGEREKLNPDCRYCLRKFACETLQKHESVGGPLSITDPVAAADRLAQLKFADSAMKGMMEELEAVVVGFLEQEGVGGFDTEAVHVELGVQNRRQPPDPVMLRRVLPDGILASHGKLTITEIDELLKGTELTDEQKSGLKKLVRTQTVGRGIKVKPLSPIGA